MTGKSSQRVLPRPIRTSSLFALLGIFSIGCLVPAQAANVLVVAGSNSLAQTAAGNLNTDLSGTNTVTVVNTGVPADLTPYTQIYDVRYNNSPALTGGEQAQYLAFLNAAPNNTLFLMGENTGFNARNGPIFQFVTLAGGGSIAAPVTNNVGAEDVNALFRTPNNISTVRFAACGLASTSGRGAFATSEAGGGCSIFFGLGALTNAPQGALVVVLDVNFIANAPNGGAVNEIAFRQNLEAFVSAPPAAPPQPSVGPAGVPTLSAWGTLLLICGLIFVAARKLRPARVAAK